MGREGYYEFLDTARDVFGLEWREAQEFYRDMRDVLGFAPSELGAEAITEYAEVADALAERFYERPDLEYHEPPPPPEPEELEPEEREEQYVERYERAAADEWDYGEDWEETEDFDDEWFDEGDEIEITAELEYTEA